MRAFQSGVRADRSIRPISNRGAIAIVYREQRLSGLEKETSTGLEQLKDEVERRRKEVEELSAAAMQIRARDGIVDSDPDKDNSSIGVFDHMLENRSRFPAGCAGLHLEQEFIGELTKPADIAVHCGTNTDKAIRCVHEFVL